MTRLHARTMSTLCRAALVAATALALHGEATAQDKAAERATRRMQLQLQSLQQQVQDAQTAKAKIETDKAASDKLVAEQAQQLGGIKGALGKTNASLRAAESERISLAAELVKARADFEKQAAEQKKVSEDAIAARDRQIAQLTQLRDGQVSALQRQRDEQTTQVGECSAKNERLVKISAELLDRYRKKTVAEVLAQKDPILGLGDVQMFNLVQEYRDKADAERFSPSNNR